MADHFVENRFVVCVNNEGFEASVEKWKVYESVVDKETEKHSEIRIIDEEGEDYVYPANCFSPVELEDATAKTFVMEHSMT